MLGNPKQGKWKYFINLQGFNVIIKNGDQRESDSCHFKPLSLTFVSSNIVDFGPTGFIDMDRQYLSKMISLVKYPNKFC